MKEIDTLSIATIRSLAIDEINQANSGHPGMSIGSAPIVYTLFSKHLVATSKDSQWFSRDRFVLSAGHASSLLYAVLHLCGYQISIDDLKHFRQLNSLTPGHPEFGHTDGVDATSGPLGQGIAQAVGLAVAEQSISHNYPDGETLCSHYTYCLCGDGCLQEGISQEAISFAGHQKLNKLILFYDANQVTLDGALDLSFTECVKNRFLASEWNVLDVADGNDVDAIDQAICEAKRSKNKPTMICVHTIIGYGSVKQGTNKCHGSPLGVEEGKRTKVEAYHFDHEDFYVPEEVYAHFKDTFLKRGNQAYEAYQKGLEKYKNNHPIEMDRFNALKGWDVSKYLPDVEPDYVSGSSLSTRAASQKALNAYMISLPNLIGGSADVAASVMTKLDGGVDFTASSRQGHNINYGIREFAMAAIQNGILLHGGLRSYIGSFFVFSDYLKPAIRLAAISHLPAIYIFSHDSIAVGEDGPTHQPIEQLAMLRSIPGVTVIRPCDERETYAAWHYALKNVKDPVALVFSRQSLPFIDTSSKEGLEKGGYVISKEKVKPEMSILATGSEVSLAIAAQKLLWEKGIDTRVVSLPSLEIFAQQSEAYQEEVLGVSRDQRISVEMQSTFGWGDYAKYHLGINTFGLSGKAGDVTKYFHFTPEYLAGMIEEIRK